MATLTDHDTFTPVADQYHLDNSCHTPADTAISTYGSWNMTRDEGSSPSSVMAGAPGIDWIVPSTRSAFLPEDATACAPDEERPLPRDNGKVYETSNGNLHDSSFLRPASPTLSSKAPHETAGSDDGTKITQCLSNSPGHSKNTDLTSNALVTVPPRVHNQSLESASDCGGRAPVVTSAAAQRDSHDTDSVDTSNTPNAEDGDLWNLTIVGLAENGAIIATAANQERPGSSWKADDDTERLARSMRIAHGKSTDTISLPVSWGGVAKFQATTATASTAGEEVVPPLGVVAEREPQGTTIEVNHVPKTNSVMTSNPFETEELTKSLQPPPLNPATSSSSDWDWIMDHTRGTPSNVATIPVEVPLAMTPQISTISFDDATSTKTPLPSSSPSTATSPYSRSVSTKSGITTHSAETERRDNSTIKPKGSAVTTHSAVTEPRRNTSHPAAHPLVVGAVGPGTSHQSQQPSRMFLAEPPPAQVVATWERSLALSLAASATPGLKTPVTASDSGLPATRMSNVMCRGANVAPPSNHSVLANLGSTDHQESQVDNTKRRLDKDHRHAAHTGSMAIMDDSSTDFGFQQEASIRKHSTSRHTEKRRTRKRNVWIFILTVAFVAVVTVTASVLATRSGSTSPSSDSVGSIQPGSGETKDPVATVSPPVLINASTTDTGFVADGEGFMEWQSSQGTTDFGSLVALNNDGSIVAIAERQMRNSSNAVVHIVPRDSEVETQSILLESEASSLALNANGTVLAVGLHSGTVSMFELDPSSHVWVKMGETIVPPGILEYQKSNHSLYCNVSVSLSGDGHVIAMGLVTPYNVAFFQVMKFDQGGWSLLGPTIQIGDDGSSTHVAASVVLSSSCSPDGQDCILTMNRMFQSDRFLFGMIAARGLNTNQTSWDSLGQALPFSLEAALTSLSRDGTVMAVSDAAATSVYRISGTESSSSSNRTQSSWQIQGQEQLPKAYQVSLAGSGRRLALATADQALVYNLVTLRSDSNETSSHKLWNLTNSFAWGESFSAKDGGLCLRLSADGMMLVLGAPNWPAGGNETGRVVVLDLD